MELKRGYKQTEVGVIPEDWEARTFGAVCRVNQGLQIAIDRRLKYPSQGAKTYITIQFLNDKKSVEFVDHYPASAYCTSDDVLMTRTGNTGIVVSGVEGVFHNNFFKINFNRKTLCQPFLISFLGLASTRRTILAKAGTSTIPDLNHGDFYSIFLPIPPLPEQHAIAGVLGDVDALIGALDRLIAKKRDLKQAAMQQLLTGQTRLPGFVSKGGSKKSEVGEIPTDWTVRPLEDIARLERGKFSARPRNDPKYFGGEYPFIQTGDVANSNGTVTSFAQTLNTEGLRVSRLFPPNTLFFTIAANIGDIAIAPFATACPDSLIAVMPNNLCVQMWLFYALGSRKKVFEGLATQNAQLNINLEKLRPYLLALPDVTEQSAITSVLSDMDTELSALEERRHKTRLLKQGMMQELLTGRIRLS